MTEEAEQRLAVFGSTNDGFRIAEADLEIRGPGDLLGKRQAGEPLFRVANLVADRSWLEIARIDAQELLEAVGLDSAEPFMKRMECRARGRYHRLAGG